MTSVVIRKLGRRRKPLTSPFNPFLRAILSCTYSACSWPPIDHSSLARNKSPTMNINIVASGSADDNVDSRSRTKGGTQLHGCLVILYGIMERKSSDLFFQMQLRFLFKMIIESIPYRKFSSRYTRFLRYNVTLRRFFVQR